VRFKVLFWLWPSCFGCRFPYAVTRVAALCTFPQLVEFGIVFVEFLRILFGRYRIHCLSGLASLGSETVFR